ncbi:hypothetical protein Kpol_1072p31 [Vanderwaltozyma polyspora DSM 70294]|uniref:mitogen-activated protein kinase kinase n=1 Tax=Vanderwaltozyma polyspora (strain ATCC 22028 / DSM 70294 / BCRC 21397 / CBS 2163 / NBRC 10782 / NRRL Y-8283 / UCD 57-17) TaxID=436907 RepID=A7TKP9_VANPO|nr:uncharacterized protein Kpol_1072p31 [Vanderwaltozyma polyspora DSM 70294]EDO17161.1 hypothetical protein Kpol_1072p31 [Vanderwaltozyma polyspora DSM 70294]
MSSIFRPPESAKPNAKSPKLTLPGLGKNSNTVPSNDRNVYLSSAPSSKSEGPSSSLGSSVSRPVTPQPPSSDSTIVPNYYKSQQINSATSSGSSSSLTKKSRPAPPPLPPLVVAKGNNSQQPGSKGSYTNLSASLQKLKINTDTTNDSLNSASSGKKTPIRIDGDTSGNMIYLSKDLNASTDSYPSALISSYDQNSSANTSPSKSPYRNGTNSTPGNDIDEIGEELWNHTHFKDEIVTLGLLGEGAGGSVAKCKLKSGSKIFALKTINTLNTDPEYQKQIFRELQFNKSFKSDYIVRYYGMFTDESNSSIFIAMEYMGGRSLDAIYLNLLNLGGRIGEKVLGKIAESVLRGLSYLHERKVIHRDIKPQNILLNEKGQVKLCDFGVSGEAVNSLATTFTGTSFYMAPERIQGQPYSVTCDVWSLGLTLLEVAQAKFPFGSDKMTATIAPIELLMLILTFSPQLKDEPELNIVWSKSFKSFIEYCLKKDPSERPSPRQMIQHPWIQGQMKKKVNMEKFVRKCWENDRT